MTDPERRTRLVALPELTVEEAFLLYQLLDRACAAIGYRTGRWAIFNALRTAFGEALETARVEGLRTLVRLPLLTPDEAKLLGQAVDRSIRNDSFGDESGPRRLVLLDGLRAAISHAVWIAENDGA